MADLFGDADLAIGAYRHAIGTLIPEVTRLALEDKQDEIRRRMPGVAPETFVFSLTRAGYDREYGTRYRKPGLFTRIRITDGEVGGCQSVAGSR